MRKLHKGDIIVSKTYPSLYRVIKRATTTGYIVSDVKRRGVKHPVGIHINLSNETINKNYTLRVCFKDYLDAI
jgi:hypothetical protein